MRVKYYMSDLPTCVTFVSNESTAKQLDDLPVILWGIATSRVYIRRVLSFWGSWHSAMLQTWYLLCRERAVI